MSARCSVCRSGAILPRPIACRDCGATEYCLTCAAGHGAPVLAVVCCGPCHRKHRADQAALPERIAALGWEPVGRVEPEPVPGSPPQFDIMAALSELLRVKT